jgi:hypothetical protein
MGDDRPMSTQPSTLGQLEDRMVVQLRDAGLRWMN